MCWWIGTFTTALHPGTSYFNQCHWNCSRLVVTVVFLIVVSLFIDSHVMTWLLILQMLPKLMVHVLVDWWVCHTLPSRNIVLPQTLGLGLTYSIFGEISAWSASKSVQHTNANKNNSTSRFFLHSSASIFVVACIYLGESLLTSGPTPVLEGVAGLPSLTVLVVMELRHKGLYHIIEFENLLKLV